MKKVKHTVRDTLILLISLGGAAWWYRRRVRKQGPLTRVLCFHDVTDRAWFAGVLDFLVARYHLVTPAEFAAQQFAADQINILLTFDDGYQSWVDVAMPELETRGLKGLFFVTSGLLDAAEADKTDNSGAEPQAVADFVESRLRLTTSREPLTWDGARALVASGHTIGGHTRNHVQMSGVSIAEAEREVREDKARLEAELGREIADFAYPFGTARDFTDETIALVQNTYPRQYTTVSRFVSPTDYTHTIPRTMLEDNQSLSSIKRWIEGGYDIFQNFKS